MEPQRLLLPLLLLSLNLQAQIYVDSTATGNNNGTSWANAYTKLQDAIAPANLPAFAVNVLVAEGTYYPDEGGFAPVNNDPDSSFVLRRDIALFGGYPAGGGGSNTRDPYRNRTILSGDLDQNDIPAKKGQAAVFVGAQANSLLLFDTSGDDTILDGFELRNADIAIDFTTSDAVSSGQRNLPTIRQCRIVNNQSGARVRGSGIPGNPIVVRPQFINCLFSGNSIEGARVRSAQPEFLNSTFHGNRYALFNESVPSGGLGYSFDCRNCIFWRNYVPSSGFTVFTPGSGLFQQPGSIVGTTNLFNCLTGGAPDPTDSLPNPRFIEEIENSEIPTDRGLLWLGLGSDSIDAGVNNTDAGGFDLVDNPRVRGASIDQGCYEARTYLHVDETAAPGGDGNSWTTAFQTVEEALPARAYGQHLLVAQGVYLPDEINSKRTNTFTLEDGALYGGFPSGGSLPKFRDPVAHKTVLSGDLLQNANGNLTDDSHHVVTIPQDSFGVVDGFIVHFGNTQGASDARGGGIYAPSNAQLFLRDSSVLLNTSTGNAGGIYLGNDSVAVIEDCLIQENNAASNGGGIYASSSAVFLNNTEFDDNSAFRGGAVYGLFSSGEWSDLLFQDNYASDTGGAAYLFTTAPGFQVSDTIFRENTADSQDGGALLEQGDPSTFEFCTFEGNTAGDDGGAVSSSGTSTLYQNCFFKGNLSSDDGGGMWTQGSSPTLTNTAFHANNAGDLGGGLAMGTGSQPTLNNSWVWKNVANGVTTTASASVYEPPRTASTFLTTVDCYLQNWSPGAGRLDGVNGPEIRVLAELDPFAAPQTGGEMHQLFPSAGFLLPSDSVLGPDITNVFLVNDVASLRSALAATEFLDLVYLEEGIYDLSNQGLVVAPGTQIAADRHDFLPTDRSASLNPSNNASRPIFTTTDNAVFTLQGSAYLSNLEIGAGQAVSPPSLALLGSGIRAASFGKVEISDCVLLGGLHSPGSDVTLLRTRVESFTANASLSVSDGDITLESCLFYQPSKIEVTNGSLSATNVEFAEMVRGFIVADSSPVALTNCGFTRSRSTSESHDIRILNQSTLTATNSFAWGYITSPSPNWIEVDASSSASYSHCLIQGLNPAGSGNINGTLAANNPLLIRSVRPDSPLPRAIPSHLSNCIDAGLNSANATVGDLNDSERIRGGTIDIGPHEHHRIYVDESSAGGNGSSWATALHNIPADLTDIRGATSIYVAEGEYNQAIKAPAGIQLFGGFPSGGSSFAQRQPFADATYLTSGVTNEESSIDSGNFTQFQNPSLVEDIPGVLDGFTFDNYTASSSLSIRPLIMGRIQTVENCLFANNTDTREPFQNALIGGAAIRIPAGTVSNLVNCRFITNSATARGGAVFVFAPLQLNTFVTDGAHIFEKCYFESNTSQEGGAVIFQSESQYQSSSELFSKMLFRFEDCAFKGNSNFGSLSSGGAIFVGTGAFGTFRDCLFQGNHSNLAGGAVSRFTGITAQGQPLSRMDFVNCTLQGNSALTAGGAVAGSARYVNTIFWGNQASEFGDHYVRAEFASAASLFKNCLVQGINLDDDPFATSQWTGNLDGTDPANDPKFRVQILAALAPTTTGDPRLTTGSPLLHAGTSSPGLTGLTVDTSGVDAAGDTRFQGSAIALGAYETPVASFYTPTETALWESDLDGDGTSQGAELLLGTNPNVFDPTHPNAFTLLNAETNPGAITEAEMTLGVNPTAPANALWVVSRSFTLEGNSFQPVLIFDGTNFNDANPSGPSSNSFALTNGLINLSSSARFLGDNGFANHPKVFYRFEAQRAPDFSYPN
jgi:predicted outer membrane repeat protein